MALNALTALVRGQSAQVLVARRGRETVTAANLQRQSARRRSGARPGRGRVRSARRHAGRSGSDRRETVRMQIARKWRRKSLERLESRPELAPLPGPSIPWPALCRLRIALDRSIASRPEMAPQSIEKIIFAPGNGAYASPVDRQAHGLRSAVDRPNASRPKMAPQRLEKIGFARGNGMAAEASDPQIEAGGAWRWP